MMLTFNIIRHRATSHATEVFVIIDFPRKHTTPPSPDFEPNREVPHTILWNKTFS